MELKMTVPTSASMGSVGHDCIASTTSIRNVDRTRVILEGSPDSSPSTVATNRLPTRNQKRQ